MRTFEQLLTLSMSEGPDHIPDDENPIFILSMTSTKLLRAIVAGEINLHAIAEVELAARTNPARYRELLSKEVEP